MSVKGGIASYLCFRKSLHCILVSFYQYMVGTLGINLIMPTFMKPFLNSQTSIWSKAEWCESLSSILMIWNRVVFYDSMMTSSNGSIFCVTGPLCGEFAGPGEFPTQRPVTRSFDVFFDLRPNKRLSKQPWLETLSWSLWCHCNVKLNHVFIMCTTLEGPWSAWW